LNFVKLVMVVSICQDLVALIDNNAHYPVFMLRIKSENQKVIICGSEKIREGANAHMKLLTCYGFKGHKNQTGIADWQITNSPLAI
jgi:hypothetical protein